jgi:hypothetical protein
MDQWLPEDPMPRLAVTLATLVAMWLAMWHLFLKHVPVLAHLKGVLVGDGKPPANTPAPRRTKIVFRGANGPAGQAGRGRRPSED